MKHTLYVLMIVIPAIFPVSPAIRGEAPPEIENSLSENQLAYYRESFDKLRSDLWDKAGLAFEEAQLENMKLADMDLEKGRLILKTKSGAYSRGGLSSRYALQGNFDIQIDCEIDFLQERLRMDQVVTFNIMDKTVDYEKMNVVALNLVKRGGSLQSYLVAGCRKSGTFQSFGSKEIDRFRGSLRIIRSGNEVSAYYKEEGAGEWERLGRISFNNNDVVIGFTVSNFVADRTEIRASRSFSAGFDNFQINAAQDIIEEEI